MGEEAADWRASKGVTHRAQGTLGHRRCKEHTVLSRMRKHQMGAAPSKIGAICNRINEEDEGDDAESVHADSDDGKGYWGYSKDNIGAYGCGR